PPPSPGPALTPFAHRHVAVGGAGRSAAHTLLDLAALAHHAPGTRISWAVRGADVSAVDGGEAQDELAARGALGTRLRHLVSTGAIEKHTDFFIPGRAAVHNGLTVKVTTLAVPTVRTVDGLAHAT